LTPSAAEVDIYLSLDLPDTDQDPIFLAKGVGWSRQGGFVGEIELELIADWGIDFNAGRSRLILRADDGGELGGTFVKINCDGFVAGRINASVLFSRNWVIPVVDGEPLTDDKINAATTSEAIYSGQRVQADFTIDIDAQNGFDFLAEMQVPMPFVFKGKEQVEVSIGIMAIDLSDVVNPTGMEVPPNYVSLHGNGPGALAPTWQGFYLAGLEIKLPEKLSKDNNPPIVVGAPYLIIDKMGITVHLFAEDILPLGEKSADGWAFSVDRVDLKITANQFEEAGIEGKINIPLLASAAANCGGSAADVPPSTLDPNDCLLYDALFIAGGDIYFTVESQTDYCADLWKAEVVIEANSKLLLNYIDDQFQAAAVLYGSISIDAQINDNFGLTMDSLSFDSLILSSQPQYFSPGTWDFPESITAQFGAFSLGFEHIEMALDPNSQNTDGRDVALSFQAYFNLDTDLDLDVAGAFQILGYLNDDDGRQKWRFKRIKVNAIQAEASTDSWSLKAAIAFYENDPEWGTGFYGSGELFLTMVGGDIGIAAVAQFGTAPDGINKYFFVDVIARLGAGIPIGPTGLKLMAIGGGLYTNMSRTDGAIQSFVEPVNDDARIDARNAVDEYETWDGTGSSPLNGIVGISTSGVSYEVNTGNKFGAFLQVVIAGANPDAFSVNARLELIVNDNGGWQARIDGNIMVMAPVNYTNDYMIDEGIGIFVHMSYTHTADYKGFKASADVFVNVAGGIIQGGQPEGEVPENSGPGTNSGEYIASGLGYAGGVSLEFSTETWYVHIGHPSPGKRIALQVGVGPFNVAFTSYFCIGKLVPPIPRLPRNVTEITGDIDMSRDFAQYENASGFAFGASLDLEAGGQFLIFYFEVTAGIGFDINIRRYGDAICLGGGLDAPAIGINGWYAAGQAWAYVTGSIGIEVNLFIFSGRVEILSAGIAAVLQMKGPNPTWARGTLAGYYSVLGGLIRDDFSIDAEFGQNCVIVGRGGEDPFANVDILSGLTPDEDSENVAVSTIPTAYLTLPLDEENELGAKIYRVSWTETQLKKVSGGNNIPGTVIKEDGAYLIQFVPDDYLDGETEYEIKASVKLESRPVNGGGWNLVKNEELVHQFTTGTPPDSLEFDNIAYSYPVAGMGNFYPQEYLNGYLKVKRTQPTLTDNITAVYTRSDDSAPITRSVTFNESANEYNWAQPVLPNSKIWKLQLVQDYSSGTGGGGGTTTSSPSGGVGGPNSSSETIPRVMSFTGTIIHTLYFRSSYHDTFSDKINQIYNNLNTSSADYTAVFPYWGEFVDQIEITGNGQTEGGLVTIRVMETETFLASSTIKAKIYDKLPFNFNGTIVCDGDHWNGLDLEILYDANAFQFYDENNIPDEVGEGHFETGTLSGATSGGKLYLGFAKETSDLGNLLATYAKVSLTRTVAYMLSSGGAMDSGIGCFSPDALAIINAFDGEFNCDCNCPFGPSYHAAENIANVIIEEGGVGEFCQIPSALINLAMMESNSAMFNITDDDYPVQFKYTLPGGKHEKNVNKTIGL